MFSRMPPFETQEPRHAFGRVATPHDTITMHRVSGNLVAREEHEKAVSRLSHLGPTVTPWNTSSKGSIEMRARPNQRLWQPWDIPKTRLHFANRLEHGVGELKKGPFPLAAALSISLY